MKTDNGRKAVLKFSSSKGLIVMEAFKREFTPSLKNKELLEQFDDFKLNGYKDCISKLLLTR